MVIMLIQADTQLKAGVISDFYASLGYKTEIVCNDSDYSIKVFDIGLELLVA